MRNSRFFFVSLSLSLLLLSVMAADLTGAFSVNTVSSATFESASLEANDDLANMHEAATRDSYYAKKLDKMGIDLKPGTDFTAESKATVQEENHCKALVYRTLASLPGNAVNKLSTLTLYYSNEGRRGLGGGGAIILRCKNVTDQELVAVLTHEMGHITDGNTLTGTVSSGESSFKDGSMPIYLNDLSLAFYKISFTDDKTLKSDVSEQDFVSGYAMSDPFEDFAESYAYYVLHGKEFAALAKTNSSLGAKYNFLKYYVFKNKEFDNGIELRDFSIRNYDVTLLRYDLYKFFLV